MCRTQHDEIRGDLRRLNKAMFGNGREGLMDRMTRAESIINLGKWVLGLVIASIATNIAALAAQLLSK